MTNSSQFYYIASILRLSVVLSMNFFRKDYTYNEKYDAHYKVIWSEVGRSFETAFMACDSDGSQLFYPRDQIEFKVINSLVEAFPKAPNTTDVLLGIRDEVGNGQYLNIDGHIVTLNIRQNDLLPQDCVVMDQKTGALQATSCEVQTNPRLFVCKKINDSPCRTIDTDYTYNEDTSKCYKVNLRRKSWKQALETCYMEGGLLVVVENDREANVIRQILPNTPEERQMFYSGFRMISDKFYTLKGIKIEDSFARWPRQEYLQPDEYNNQDYNPDQIHYNETYLSPPLKCGILRKLHHNSEIYTSAANCEDRNPFICEIQAGF